MGTFSSKWSCYPDKPQWDLVLVFTNPFHYILHYGRRFLTDSKYHLISVQGKHLVGNLNLCLTLLWILNIEDCFPLWQLKHLTVFLLNWGIQSLIFIKPFMIWGHVAWHSLSPQGHQPILPDPHRTCYFEQPQRRSPENLWQESRPFRWWHQLFVTIFWWSYTWPLPLQFQGSSSRKLLEAASPDLAHLLLLLGFMTPSWGHGGSAG